MNGKFNKIFSFIYENIADNIDFVSLQTLDKKV